MVRDWEAQLREWGHAPGPDEQRKMENTEGQIRTAIKASTALVTRGVDVLAQGSYKNLTHIHRESDVDIRVVLKDSFFYDLSLADPNTKDEAVRVGLLRRFNISPATYSFDTFRDDVGKALVARFGPVPAVTPGDKAFNIHETRYFVDADVVAALEHRRYRADGTYAEGVEFVSRKGQHIVNWPEQQFRNGIEKNKVTSERFKAMVRALKNLRVEMDDQEKPAAAKPISSFLIECLVWNVPNDRFGHTDYYDDMKEVLRFLYLNTTSDETCWDWGEESELKYLLRGGQGWTRAQANAFVLAAWGHVGFKN